MCGKLTKRAEGKEGGGITRYEVNVLASRARERERTTDSFLNFLISVSNTRNKFITTWFENQVRLTSASVWREKACLAEEMSLMADKQVKQVTQKAEIRSEVMLIRVTHCYSRGHLKYFRINFEFVLEMWLSAHSFARSRNLLVFQSLDSKHLIS